MELIVRKLEVPFIVNDIKNFVFGPAKAPVYGFGRNRKQKFVMSFTIYHEYNKDRTKRELALSSGRVRGGLV